MPSLADEKSLAVRILAAHLERKRLAHSYILAGTPGPVKDELALSFARALNCEKGKRFESCDCASCHKIESQSHPDVRWLGEDTKLKSIKIEEVRELKNWAALKPYEGKWKVFLIQASERLTAEAQNALLKTLEEPPEHTIFMLLAENKAHLFDTIRSRSFEIPVHSPEPQPEDGQRVDFLYQLREKPWEEFLEGYATASRDEARRMLDGLMRIFRDLLEEKAGGDNAFAFSLIQGIERVYETKEALEDNANQKLALTRLAMRLRSLLPQGKL